MQIPQPPGWEFAQIDAGEASARIVQSNQALTANQYAPTVAVVMDAVSTNGGWSPRQWSTQELFDDQRSGLELEGADIQSTVPTTVCGQPAEISDYAMRLEGVSPLLFGKLVLVVVKSDNETYLAALTVTTSDRDNPIYQRDSQAIVDGFIILPSSL